MTSKKRRQRGSRTHGGGTHKNRRGAGHRGGRGKAGRDKHEFHNYESRKKHGFKRPQDARDDVLEIDVRTLDENAIAYVDEGLATERDSEADAEPAFVIDARDVVENGHEADVVKVLGNGQVHHSIEVTADAFTDTAREKLEASGGDAVLSERAQKEAAATDAGAGAEAESEADADVDADDATGTA